MTTPDQQTQSEREQFEEFVKRELGDVPVMDNGRYVSMKINNYWRTWLEARRAALSAPQAGVPEDWQVVPKIATEDMWKTAIRNVVRILDDEDKNSFYLAIGICVAVYKDMLAAAPTAPVQAVGQWLDIETAPKDGSLFLCWVSAVRYGETDEGQQYQQDASQFDFCSWRDGPPDLPGHGYFDPCCGQIGDSQAVTHWMPLPPALGAPAQVPAPPVLTWTDKHRVKHAIPTDSAVKLLKEFYGRWPGGLDEIEASVRSWRRAAARYGHPDALAIEGPPPHVAVPAPGDSKAAPVRLSEQQIAEAVYHLYGDPDHAEMMLQRDTKVARSIERASLRANGLGGGE